VIRCSKNLGFTLVEMLLSLGIASVIMAGVFMNFTSQSNQYQFQDARANTIQDMEFSLRYIVQDMQSALMLDSGSDVYELKSGAYVAGVNAPSIKIAPSTDGYSTSALSFRVWDPEEPGANAATQRVDRCYVFDAGMIKYDRDETTCPPVTMYNSGAAIIGETAGLTVTRFRVFLDDPADTSRLKYSDIPLALPLPSKTLRDKDNKAYYVPGFTILLEVEVDADNAGSDGKDVLGQPVAAGRQRLWRYIQLYPSVLVSIW